MPSCQGPGQKIAHAKVLGFDPGMAVGTASKVQHGARGLDGRCFSLFFQLGQGDNSTSSLCLGCFLFSHRAAYPGLSGLTRGYPRTVHCKAPGTKGKKSTKALRLKRRNYVFYTVQKNLLDDVTNALRLCSRHLG